MWPTTDALGERTLRGTGHWDLATSGVANSRWLTPDDSHAVAGTFRLPADAVQGKPLWYLIRLHVAVKLDPHASGLAYISASANGLTGAQVEFRVRHLRNGVRPQIVWRTTDLLDGTVEHHTHSPLIVADMRNFLQYRAVQGGENELEIGLEGFNGVNVERWRVLPDSGLSASRRGPPRIKLVPNVSGESIEEGQSTNVRFTLESIGDRPVPQATVLLRPVTPGLSVIGPGASTYQQLSAEAHGTFELGATAAGELRAQMLAIGGANHPIRPIHIPVASRGTSPERDRVLLQVLGGLALLVAAALALRQRQANRRR